MPTTSTSRTTTKGRRADPLVQRRLPTRQPPTRVTGMSADFWLGLQQDSDLWHALRSEEAKEIEQLKPLLASSEAG